MSGLKNFFVGKIVTNTRKEIITSSICNNDLRDEKDLQEYSEFVSAMGKEVSKKGVTFLNKINGFSSSARASVLEPIAPYNISAAVNFFSNGSISGGPGFLGSTAWYSGALKNPASSYIITSSVSTYGNHNNWPGGTTTTGGPNGVNLGSQRQFTYAVNSNPTQNSLTAGATYSITITSTSDGNSTSSGVVQVECAQVW